MIVEHNGRKPPEDILTRLKIVGTGLVIIFGLASGAVLWI